MTDKVKKQLILNLPYLILVYLFNKLYQGYGWRLGRTLRRSCSTSGRAFRRPLPVWCSASIWWTCAWAPPARC